MWLNLAVKLCIWHDASLAVFCLDGTISSLLLNSLLSTEALFDEILKLSLKLLQGTLVLRKVSVLNSLQPQPYKKPRHWKTVRKLSTTWKKKNLKTNKRKKKQAKTNKNKQKKANKKNKHTFIIYINIYLLYKIIYYINIYIYIIYIAYYINIYIYIHIYYIN